jgi:hypothetical protein
LFRMCFFSRNNIQWDIGYWIEVERLYETT